MIGRVRLSAERLRAVLFGGTDADITGATWDEASRSVILTVEGSTVLDYNGLLKVQKVVSEETRFVPDTA